VLGTGFMFLNRLDEVGPARARVDMRFRPRGGRHSGEAENPLGLVRISLRRPRVGCKYARAIPRRTERQRENAQKARLAAVSGLEVWVRAAVFAVVRHRRGDEGKATDGSVPLDKVHVVVVAIEEPSTHARESARFARIIQPYGDTEVMVPRLFEPACQNRCQVCEPVPSDAVPRAQP
jgi:hypothetical protein